MHGMTPTLEYFIDTQKGFICREPVYSDTKVDKTVMHGAAPWHTYFWPGVDSAESQLS